MQNLSVSFLAKNNWHFFPFFFFPSSLFFFPLATRSEGIPFSDSFVAQSVFSTQPHGQSLHPPPSPTNPCFNLIMMRFADTMNICNDPGVSVNGMDFQPPISKAHTHMGGRDPGAPSTQGRWVSPSWGRDHPLPPQHPLPGWKTSPQGPWCLPCPLPRQSGRPVPFTGPHYSPQGK